MFVKLLKIIMKLRSICLLKPNCANYRGVSILNIAYKVLSGVLCGSLKPTVDTHYLLIDFKAASDSTKRSWRYA